MDQINPKDSFTHLFKELMCGWLQLEKLHQHFSNKGNISTLSKCLELFLQYVLAHYSSALQYKTQPYQFPISSIKSSSINCPFILCPTINHPFISLSHHKPSIYPLSNYCISSPFILSCPTITSAFIFCPTITSPFNLCLTTLYAVHSSSIPLYPVYSTSTPLFPHH